MFSSTLILGGMIVTLKSKKYQKSYIYFSNSIIKSGANLTNLKIIYPTIDETLSPIRKALLILKNHKSINKICFLVNKEEDIEVIKKRI